MLALLKRHVALPCALLLIALAFAWTSWAVSPRTKQVTPGSRNSPEGFRLALPGYEYSFPRDHGAHPPFQTEWWYYTGHLQTTTASSQSRKSFGYQLTFFRTALTPGLRNRKSKWATRDVIFGHLALTDENGKRFYFTDRISRAALDLADAQTLNQSSTPRIHLGEWSLQFNKATQHVKASGSSERESTPFALDLIQTPHKAPVVHGENGVSQKSAGRGRASHYYSFTRLQTTGTIKLAGREYSVTGASWFDHEFGSNQLATNQAGWDWFSLQLDDGRELMLYQLRLKDGGIDTYSSGTLIEKNGAARHLKREEFQVEVLDWWISPHTQARYPARWALRLPNEELEIFVEPTVPDQELQTARSTGITYWEGSVRVSDSQNRSTLSGRGYVELTGYDRAFDGTF